MVTGKMEPFRQGEVDIAPTEYCQLGRFCFNGRELIPFPETNSEFTPENVWLEYEFPFWGPGLFPLKVVLTRMVGNPSCDSL